MTEQTLTTEERQIGMALLLVRIAAGIAFIYHGAGILFGSFGGPGIAGFAKMSHMPEIVAVLVGLAEFCGGIAVLTGILARLGGVCIAIVMAGAILLVHLPHGYDMRNQGAEYALTQMLIALAIAVAGAGPYSLARFVARPSGSRGPTPVRPGPTHA